MVIYMKLIKNKYIAGAFLTGLLPCVMQAAQAASFYDGSATVNYVIQSVTNLDNPGNTSDLEISGNFGATHQFTDYSGDGSSSVNVNADETNFQFSKQAEGGSPVNGFAESSYSSIVDMFFINNGNDRFEIEVSMEYSLMAGVIGEAADSSVFLDYEARLGEFSGFDAVFASTFGDLNDVIDGADMYSFVLGAGDEEAISAAITMDGLAEATGKIVPVPEPSVLLLMLAAFILLPVFSKRNLIQFNSHRLFA